MINSIADLGFQLGLNIQYLENLINRSDFFYKNHFIKKKNGKDRKISSPNYQIKAIQAWILRNILEEVPISSRAHGFAKGRGIRTNARIHLGKKYVLCLDIEDFFPSIR